MNVNKRKHITPSTQFTLYEVFNYLYNYNKYDYISEIAYSIIKMGINKIKECDTFANKIICILYNYCHRDAEYLCKYFIKYGPFSNNGNSLNIKIDNKKINLDKKYTIKFDSRKHELYFESKKSSAIETLEKNRFSDYIKKQNNQNKTEIKHSNGGQDIILRRKSNIKTIPEVSLDISDKESSFNYDWDGPQGTPSQKGLDQRRRKNNRTPRY